MLGVMEEEEVRVRVLTWETWMVRVMVAVEVVVATVVSWARARRGRRMARKRLMSCILMMVGLGRLVVCGVKVEIQPLAFDGFVCSENLREGV